MAMNEALFTFSVRQADSALVLAQRLCEWCGHGPVLEEDIAMSNMGLDLIGQSRGYYSYAANIEGGGRSEDDLAFHRNEREFMNRCLVEQPNGDFGHTMMRSFFYSAFSALQHRELRSSTDETISGVAQKAWKELQYHARHTGQWIVRLGDGTEESHQRIQSSLDELWSFTEELFDTDRIDEQLVSEGIICDIGLLKPEWDVMVNDVLHAAGLVVPPKGYRSKGGMHGVHTEYLGHMLSEMQYLPRAYPDARW
jgi:ring-1,2-phenylacetyl-CoA epoxidase subunit PaaC